MKLETLQKMQAWATIIATLVVPLLVVLIGKWIEAAIAEQGTKRDYVQIAVSILNRPPSEPQDPRLRAWAVQLIDSNAPIPLSTDLAASLKVGDVRLPSKFLVPIQLSCVDRLPRKPESAFDDGKLPDNVFEQVKLLLIELERRKAYERELEAILEGCR